VVDGTPRRRRRHPGRLARGLLSNPESAAAVFEVLERTPQRIVWRCVESPPDWRDTRITFTLKPRDDGGTTLLFSHEGWKEENEFMNGCTTNWAAYLMSLKIRCRRPMASTPTLAARSARWN
jgi:Activator of Hsp90 ATPase homolog 1-like protein